MWAATSSTRLVKAFLPSGVKARSTMLWATARESRFDVALWRDSLDRKGGRPELTRYESEWLAHRRVHGVKVCLTPPPVTANRQCKSGPTWHPAIWRFCPTTQSSFEAEWG